MNDMTDYIKKQYAAQAEAELAGLKGAYEQSRAGYDAQLADLPAQYERQRNAAAAQNAIARRNFNERAAATGLNTGTSGQAELARSSAYQNALAGIGTAQSEAQQQLERGRLDLDTQYQNAIAAQRAKNEAALGEALYNEMLRRQSQQQSAGETLLKAGLMPDGDQLAAMGMTSDQAQQYINALTNASYRSGGTTYTEPAAPAVVPEEDPADVPARAAAAGRSGGTNDVRVLGLGTYAPVDVMNMLARGEVVYDPAAKAYKATTAAQRTLTARRLTR